MKEKIETVLDILPKIGLEVSGDLQMFLRPSTSKLLDQNKYDVFMRGRAIIDTISFHHRAKVHGKLIQSRILIFVQQIERVQF